VSDPLAPAAALAAAGRLYPAVILHGGSAAARRVAAVRLATTLLCERQPDARPCGDCRHCRRIAEPGEGEAERFHPDFAWLERDLKTSTSAESTRDLVRGAQQSPFEARGQVFVIADAASLSAEASDALLKAIEEPGLKAPRHFLLLAPSRLDLAPTVRSRALAVFLGAGERPDPAKVEAAARKVRAGVARATAAPPGAAAFQHLAIAAELAPKELGDEVDFSDPRAARPWIFAASVARAAAGLAEEPSLGARETRRLLALAEALLTAPPLRLRGIPAERILEGLVSRHLGAGG
jgi:hypothetical protein